MSKGIFTACKSRGKDKCPPWSLQAKEISHDKAKKTIYYEHALLKLYNVPIFYFPSHNGQENEEIRFGEIQQHMQISEAEVEEFLIDVLKTKLVRAKIDQGNQVRLFFRN